MDKQTEDYIEKLENHVDRLEKLVEQALSISRDENGENTIQSLIDMVNDEYFNHRLIDHQYGHNSYSGDLAQWQKEENEKYLVHAKSLVCNYITKNGFYPDQSALESIKDSAKELSRFIR